MKFGRVSGDMKNTDYLSEHLIRLPLWVGITEAQQKTVTEELQVALQQPF